MQRLPISVITLIVLSVLFVLFKRLSPSQATQILTNKPIEELRKKYRKYDFIQLGLLYALTIILTFVFYYLFTALTDFRISVWDQIVIIVKPFMAAWLLASMFTAMLTATIVIPHLIKKVMKENWDEYTAYNDLKYGFNTLKVGRIFTRVFAVITGILIIAFFDWYSAFR